MEIIKQINGDELVLKIVGELNTSTYVELEEVVSKSLNGVKTLVFDFSELVYISSAGLRILLTAKKMMDTKQGKMIIRHANNVVMEIFDITGFSNILDFEK